MSKIIFGTLDKRNQVNVELKVTPYMEELFAQYRLGQHTVEPTLQEAGVSQAGQSTSQPPPVTTNPPPTIPSIPLVDREPTANISQKIFVSKKKRKQATLKIVSDMTETSEDTDTLGLRLKKKKIGSGLTTQGHSVSSQQGTAADMGHKQVLGASSQQGASIEIGKSPIAPGNAPSQDSLPGEERRNKDGTSTKGIYVEPPPSTQGEVPKISPELITRRQGTYLLVL